MELLNQKTVNAIKNVGTMKKEERRVPLVFIGLEKKRKKPLSDVLQEFELPAGIFPREATKYVLDEVTRKLTVSLPTICEVSYRDSSVLRFSTSVTCHIEKGKLSEIEGLKTKVVIWVRVTNIVCEEAKLHFTAGLNKTRERKVYQVVRDGVPVDKF
ncbi:hypothetical protein R6Q57_024490 [Mikania cordata]